MTFIKVIYDNGSNGLIQLKRLHSKQLKRA